MDFIPSWADAVARFEGFYSAGSRPARDHNPGDLKFAGQFGAIGKDAQGFAVFPDDATGFQALYNQLAKYVRDFPGYSLTQIMAHYLGQHSPEIDAQGNAFTYANAVAGEIGVSPDTTIGDLASAGATTTADPSTAPPDTSGDGPDNGGILSIVVIGGLLFWAVTKIFNG